MILWIHLKITYVVYEYFFFLKKKSMIIIKNNTIKTKYHFRNIITKKHVCIVSIFLFYLNKQKKNSECNITLFFF